MIYGETVIERNIATSRGGGGIYLFQSTIGIRGQCVISQNHAKIGGGIHAMSSTISVHQFGSLYFIGNSAALGGGIHMEVNSRLIILAITPPEIDDNITVIFSDNHADYGGAIYINDDTSSACTNYSECSIQRLILISPDQRSFNNSVSLY